MKKALLFCIPAMLLATSCVNSLTDYNVDPKNATIAPGTAQVSYAEKWLTRTVISANTNIGPFRYYVQYWAATTYPQESRYDINTRAINANLWNPLYREVLVNLKDAKRTISADATLDPKVKANQVASIEVLEVYTWATLVDLFGNVPYSEALDFTKPQPKYDDAATIYSDLFARLNSAIGQFDPNAKGLGAADLLNNGDVSQWVKFANSLKLRMALTISDVDAAKAKTLAQETAGKVLASNADNIDLTFNSSSPNQNPLYEDLVTSGRSDFVGASTFVDKLNVLNDPRRSAYFKKAPGDVYKGGIYGAGNSYDQFSAPGTKLESATAPGVLISYSQVEFLLAEAVERGFTANGTAEDHYNKAVTASIQEWGGSAADAATYLAQPSVAYATAAGTYKDKIGIQKWIALYGQPTDSYREWRRLDSPKLIKTPQGLTDIPLRINYPITESNINGANYTAAAAAIGGDVVTQKLFWDKF